MVPKSKILFLLSILMFGLIFAGCRSSSLNVPTPAVDLEATEKSNLQRTEAAATLAAVITNEAMGSTLTAAAPTATHTLAPTRTRTAVFTVTPVLESPSPTPTALTPEITAPVLLSTTDEVTEWQCNLIRTTPSYKSILPRGRDFETHWILLNSGSETWYDNVSISYRNGMPMHTNDGKMSVTGGVKNGDLYEIVVPMKAPQEPGAYTSVWILTFKKEAFCWFSVDIVVE